MPVEIWEEFGNPGIRTFGFEVDWVKIEQKGIPISHETVQRENWVSTPHRGREGNLLGGPRLK